MGKRFVLAICLAALGGCATAAPGSPLTGNWGGEHVGLVLDDTGGRLDYDCASGSIAEPLIPAGDGTFSARGTHTPGQGGPDRIGYVPPSYPARYSGTVSGSSMILRVEVPSREIAIGPLRLRRDEEPVLVRCL